MAFLNNLKFRPACVFSDLPPKFMEPLIRDLEGSVAVSTCDLDELHHAVQLRGASLAVIGASAKSYKIAEDLSHDKLAVKVFLVRFDDNFANPIYKNGFAGVVDLRTDYRQFAETLRDAASSGDSPVPRPPAKRGRSLLRMLQHLHDKSHELEDISELILDGFLETAQASHGLFISPANEGSFDVVSKRGFTRDLPASFRLPAEFNKALNSGNAVRSLKGKSLEVNWRGLPVPKFTLALPLMSESRLSGCLLCNSDLASETLMEYGAFASRLWAGAQKEKFMDSIRIHVSKSVSSSEVGWALISPDEKIVHEEGCPGEWNFHVGGNVKLPRLKDLVQKALRGQENSVEFQNHTLRYSCKNIRGIDHALLVAHERPPFRAGSENLPHEVALRFVHSELEPSSSVDLGARMIGLENVESTLSTSLTLIARTCAKLLDRSLTFKVSSSGAAVTLIFEADESALQEPLSEQVRSVQFHWLMKLAISAISPRLSLVSWHAGTFGGKLAFQCSSPVRPSVITNVIQ